jgi:hypothetical protein
VGPSEPIVGEERDAIRKALNKALRRNGFTGTTHPTLPGRGRPSSCLVDRTRYVVEVATDYRAADDGVSAAPLIDAGAPTLPAVLDDETRLLTRAHGAREGQASTTRRRALPPSEGRPIATGSRVSAQPGRARPLDVRGVSSFSVRAVVKHRCVITGSGYARASVTGFRSWLRDVLRPQKAPVVNVEEHPSRVEGLTGRHCRSDAAEDHNVRQPRSAAWPVDGTTLPLGRR